MAINPRKYIEVDKRFPDSMTGDADRVLVVKNDESGYEHSPAITVEHVVGSIIMFPMDIPPNGYLMCDGAEYDVTTYPALGALLGENAPGSGKFNTPDISFVKNSKGVSTGTKETAKVGEHDHDGVTGTGGKHGHTITMDSQKNHSHSISGGDHNHNLTVYQGQDLDAGSGVRRNDQAGPSATHTISGGGHSHSVEAAGAHTHVGSASTQDHHTHKIPTHGIGEVTQPACTLINFCIRT